MMYAARAAGIAPLIVPELGRELTWKDVIAVWKLYRHFGRLQPDVVHTHTAKAGAVGRVAAWLYRCVRLSALWGRPRPCCVVHTFHGHIFHSYFGPVKTRLFIGIERFLARWMTDRIVVLSERQRDEIHRTFRVGRSGQFHVIPIAVDVETLDGCARRRVTGEGSLRGELGVSDKAFLVGIVGRLVPIKNHTMFLDAVKHYFRSHSAAARSVHFVVIGDGELRRALEEQAAELDLTEHISFLGHRCDRRVFYAGLDAVALTSRNEGTPMSLLEAMSAGVPVVATLVGGVPDLLGRRQTIDPHGYEVCERGLGVAAADAAALAHAIVRLCGDADLRDSLTREARRYVGRHFTRAHVVAETARVFADALERRPRGSLHSDLVTTSKAVPLAGGRSQSAPRMTAPPGTDPRTVFQNKESLAMRVLITGGAGFIGSHLADACLERGAKVVVIDDLSTGRLTNIEHLIDSPRFALYQKDVRDEDLLDELMANCDCVFHLAAAVGVKLVVESPVRTIETNIQGTEAVLRVAARHGCRVLITSTSEVYGLSDKVPFREDDPLVMGSSTRGRWSYACSKAIDEFLALAYHKERGLPAIVVRLFNTVGPRQTDRYGMVIPTFIRQALLGEPITVYGDGRQTRCFSFVTDVVAALMALMDHSESPGEVFNIGSDEEVSIAELAELVKVKTGSASDILMVPYAEAYRSGFEDMPRRVPDVSKLERYLGFRPNHSLEEILDGVIVSLREELPMDAGTTAASSRAVGARTHDAQ
jgi:UDP-glucose 4-epimerase